MLEWSTCANNLSALSDDLDGILKVQITILGCWCGVVCMLHLNAGVAVVQLESSFAECAKVCLGVHVSDCFCEGDSAMFIPKVLALWHALVPASTPADIEI